MDEEDKQVILTAAWLFMQHGQTQKAKALCREVNEQEPSDGVCGALLAQLYLDDAEPEEALEVIRNTTFPPELERVAALLEARALKDTGHPEEGRECWQKYLEQKNGRTRRWVVEQ